MGLAGGWACKTTIGSHNAATITKQQTPAGESLVMFFMVMDVLGSLDDYINMNITIF